MTDRLVQKLRADVWQSALSTLALVIALPEIARQVQVGLSTSTLLLALSAVAVIARVRYPEPALGAQLLITMAMVVVSDMPVSLGWGFALICLVSLASLRGRTTVILSAVCVLLVLWGSSFIDDPQSWQSSEISSTAFSLLWFTVGAIGTGTAVQVQRQYIRALQEREARAIENRETEVQRRVVEERLRIARELHDSVAHQIAVVGMFTGLARTSLTTSPEKAEQALARVQEATRTVLTELQQILSLLREPATDTNDPVTEVPERPVPGLDDIGELIRSFDAIGMAIRLTIEGTPQPVSTATGAAAYWVMQEALTNTHKHGDGAVDAQIEFRDATVVIEVVNRLPRPAERTMARAHQPGFGLVGMQERVRAVGGTLTSGAEGECYRVAVELPLDGVATGQPVGALGQPQERAP